MPKDMDLSDLATELGGIGEDNSASMWQLMEELFPLYRSLCGPGFLRSLEIINETLALEINEYPTGEDVLGWKIPEEFEPIEAWVETPDGKRIFDFAEHPYHLWIYSRPFSGVVSREELLKHVIGDPRKPEAIALRHTYFIDNWGFCARPEDIAALPPGDYKVHIDTRLTPGKLRIGEHYLPGKTEKEILISSYLCHPRGANDNLSGVVVAVELFRLLAQLPERHYSYRLVLWPETIGPMAYIAKHPDRIKKMVGGYQIAICGDSSPIGLDQTYYGDSGFDRAAEHAMKLCGVEVVTRPYNLYIGDPAHFNTIGLRIPVANITRGGSRRGGYRQYHASTDEPGTVVTQGALLETLEVAWTTLMVMDRTRKFRVTFDTTPFLAGYNIFPYSHGAGNGGSATVIGDAYYALVQFVDGEKDLLELAERAELPIFAFDEAIRDFLRVGLLEEIFED